MEPVAVAVKVMDWPSVTLGVLLPLIAVVGATGAAFTVNATAVLVAGVPVPFEMVTA